jgi:hypothetical protein
MRQLTRAFPCVCCRVYSEVCNLAVAVVTWVGECWVPCQPVMLTAAMNHVNCQYYYDDSVPVCHHLADLTSFSASTNLNGTHMRNVLSHCVLILSADREIRITYRSLNGKRLVKGPLGEQRCFFICSYVTDGVSYSGLIGW